MNKIKAVVIPEMEAPYVAEITPELGEFQRLVGGWIEAVPTTSELCIYGNEEAKLVGMSANQNAAALEALNLTLHPDDYVAGPLVVTGFSYDDGESVSLPDKIVAKLTNN